MQSNPDTITAAGSNTDTMTDTTDHVSNSPEARPQLGLSLTLTDTEGTMIVFDPKRV